MASGGYNNNLVAQNNGNTTIIGNIDFGGGIARTGSDAFINTSAVDSANYSNTHLSLKIKYYK